jgi:hypothetical protein
VQIDWGSMFGGIIRESSFSLRVGYNELLRVCWQGREFLLRLLSETAGLEDSRVDYGILCLFQ